MELVFVWMPLVAAGIVAATLAVLVILRRRSGRDDTDIVSAAHTERLLRMPEYRDAYRRAMAKLGAMVLLVLVALGAFSIVAARPITTDVADKDRTPAQTEMVRRKRAKSDLAELNIHHDVFFSEQTLQQGNGEGFPSVLHLKE